MDFWRDKESGQLYAHGLICDGEGENGEIVEGAMVRDAKTEKPLWMPWSHFKARFEHVEMRTSSEAWRDSASNWYLAAFMLAYVGSELAVGCLMLWWSGISTHPFAWLLWPALLIMAAWAYLRSRRAARNYQWDSHSREIFPLPGPPS